MGCDIHGTVEHYIDGEWVLIREIPYPKKYDHDGKESAQDRLYDRFALLAGVRGEGPAPKGLPDDISAGTKYYFEGWEADAHSMSWNNAVEFVAICEQTSNRERSKWALALPEQESLSYWLEIDDYYDREQHYEPLEVAVKWRVIYWFDN